MGYIRSNEDYYKSLGFSKIQVELDKRNIDYGFCNPIKAKLAAEEEEEIRENLQSKDFTGRNLTLLRSGEFIKLCKTLKSKSMD